VLAAAFLDAFSDNPLPMRVVFSTMPAQVEVLVL